MRLHENCDCKLWYHQVICSLSPFSSFAHCSRCLHFPDCKTFPPISGKQRKVDNSNNSLLSVYSAHSLNKQVIRPVFLCCGFNQVFNECRAPAVRCFNEMWNFSAYRTRVRDNSHLPCTNLGFVLLSSLYNSPAFFMQLNTRFLCSPLLHSVYPTSIAQSHYPKIRISRPSAL